MADSIPRCMSAALIHKLHALAERRCAHLLDLHQSGRWRRFYTREEFMAQIGDATKAARQWQEMADAADTPAPEPTPVVEMIPIESLASKQEVTIATAIRQWRASVAEDGAEVISAA
ncbi:MAG TPA: TIGR03809 family protein [Xanthobacteraceae bacterium]|nr:TIGR03809 family protein [Xanthobacteraceae bacterium]